MEQEEQHKRKGFSKLFYTRLYILLGAALVALLLFNVLQVNSIYNDVGKKIDEAKEAARPANVELAVITASSCTDCFDIIGVVDQVKSSNVNVVKEQTINYPSEEAKSLIQKYNLEKIPTVIITGEVEKASLTDFEKIDDALIFTNQYPPYTDAESGQVLGGVSATIVKDNSCDECTDLTQIITSIKNLGVKVTEEKIVDKNGEEGQNLITKYEIKKLPTLIMSQDIGYYDESIQQLWSQVGRVSSDGHYILDKVNPPYIDLNTNKVVGLVSMTKLTDKTCTTCYDPDNFHKPILKNMGVFVDKENTIDISESAGSALISKYNITKVPTILLEGDVAEYPILVQAWQPVGTKEADGVYIFRNLEVTGQTYKDLTTNKIVSTPPT